MAFASLKHSDLDVILKSVQTSIEPYITSPHTINFKDYRSMVAEQVEVLFPLFSCDEFRPDFFLLIDLREIFFRSRVRGTKEKKKKR